MSWCCISRATACMRLNAKAKDEVKKCTHVSQALSSIPLRDTTTGSSREHVASPEANPRLLLISRMRSIFKLGGANWASRVKAQKG